VGPFSSVLSEPPGGFDSIATGPAYPRSSQRNGTSSASVRDTLDNTCDCDINKSRPPGVRPAGSDRLGNGQEFRGRALTAWREERGVRLDSSQPGKPGQNAYVENFNDRWRDKCLNANWFTSLGDARRKIESWGIDYNPQRSRSSLQYTVHAAVRAMH
jgi:hypothetical protein